jgi:hypothetical protein
MMGDFIHLSQRYFSMTRINHADWAVAFFSMTKINHVDWAKHDPMDIRDLDYFLARGKAGSFTAAARDALIGQSAMSSAIARLARDLGVQLCDRGVMPIAPTEYGAALQAGAQRILDAVQAGRDGVAAVSGQIRPGYLGIKLRQSRTVQWAPAIGRRWVNGYRPMR